MKKLKVIHVEHCSHSYFVNTTENLDEVVKGSWGTQVAKEMKKYYPEIEVEAWFPEKVEVEAKGFEYENVKMRIFPTTFSPMYALDFSWKMISALKEEVRRCEKENIKLIIHIHEIHNLHGLIITSLFKNQKLVCQHHGGSWPLKHLKQTKKYKWFFPFFWFGQMWENLILDNVQVYFALSPEEISYLRRRTNSKIIFQTMGISEDYFRKVNKRVARRALKLDVNKKIIVFIGRINQEKGIGYLLDSMRKLKDIELKIIGYTQDIEKFKKYSKENGLENVMFLGGVFGEKKRMYLSSADALILPSLKEGAPVTVMESLARGTPVIVTNVGGVSLMVHNNREGLIINQRDSKDIVRGVREFFNNSWTDVSEYATVYKWKRIIENTLKAYDEIFHINN